MGRYVAQAGANVGSVKERENKEKKKKKQPGD
jgi:hypothetical protein